MNLFNQNNGVMNFLSRLADYMILSLLWFLCSLPLVTIGASTTALFYCSLKILNNQDTYVTKDFFRSFKQNFKQSTILWLIAVVFGYICVADLHFYLQVDSSWASACVIIFVAISVLYVFTMLYLFPYLSKFYCTIKQAIKNSLLLSLRHLGYTILMVIVDAAIVIAALYYGLLIIFLPGLLALSNGFLLKYVFKRYIPEEEEEDVATDDFTTIEEIEKRDAAAKAAAEAAESDSAEKS